MTLFLLSTLTFLTASLSAVAGMAGGTILISLLTFFVSAKDLIPLHGITQLVSNSTRTILLRKAIVWPFMLPFLSGTIPGFWIGVWLLQSFYHPALTSFFIALLIFYSLFKPEKLPPLKLKNWQWFLVGFISCPLSLLAGAVGPFLSVFFVRDDLKKEQVMGTFAAMQVINHALKIPSFLMIDYNYLAQKEFILMMAFSTIMGAVFGVKILGALSHALFQKIFKGTMFLIGLKLLYDVLKHFIH